MVTRYITGFATLVGCALIYLAINMLVWWP